MKRLFLSFILILSIILPSISALASTFEYWDAYQTFNTMTTTNWSGTTVNATSNHTITGVTLYTNCTLGLAVTGRIWIADNASKSTELAYAEYSHTGNGSAGLTTFMFNVPVSIEAGEDYFIGARATSAGSFSVGSYYITKPAGWQGYSSMDSGSTWNSYDYTFAPMWVYGDNLGTAATLVYDGAYSITSTSAWVNAQITSHGSSGGYTWYRWSWTDTPGTWENWGDLHILYTPTVDGQYIGEFIDGLSSNTTYYVSCITGNNVSYSWVGNSYEYNFTTQTSEYDIIEMYTGSSQYLSPSIVLFNGAQISGSQHTIARGFLVSTSNSTDGDGALDDSQVIDLPNQPPYSNTAFSYQYSSSIVTGYNTLYFQTYGSTSENTFYGQVCTAVKSSSFAGIPILTADNSTVDGVNVTLSGTITSLGGGSIYNKGFEASTSSGDYNNSSRIWTWRIASGDMVAGSWSQVLPAATPGQTYYWRAFALGEGGYGYSDEKTFSIGNNPPTVTSVSAYKVSATSCNMTGYAVPYTGVAITQEGFQFSYDANNLSSNVSETSSNNHFSWYLTGVDADKILYWRAFALGENGMIGYGAIRSLNMATGTGSSGGTGSTGGTGTGSGQQVARDVGTSINEVMELWGMNSSAGKMIVTLIFMIASFALFKYYKADMAAKVAPIIIFGIAITIGWISGVIITMLGLAAGLFGWWQFRRRTVGG